MTEAEVDAYLEQRAARAIAQLRDLTAERKTYVEHAELCERVAQLESDAEAVRQTLTGRIVELEHTCAVQQEAIDALLDVTDAQAGRVNGHDGSIAALGDMLKSALQRVRDLTAQLAQHEAAPYPHLRYDMLAVGEVVLDGLMPDYDVTEQREDGPILDADLTDAQRARIWRNVKAAVEGE